MIGLIARVSVAPAASSRSCDQAAQRGSSSRTSSKTLVSTRIILSLGACLSIPRGRDRGRFPLRQGGADAVGYAPNKEATTPHEGKSARSRRVGKERGVCGVARLVHSIHYGPRRAPCIRSPRTTQWRGPSPTASHGYTALPTRLT